MKEIILRVKQARRDSYLLALALILLLLFPHLLSTYNVSLLTEVLIWVIFALSLNLLLGYTGLISLGHAAYFGMGGYTIALLTVIWGYQNFWFCMLFALIVVVILSFAMGFLVVRSTGVYFLMLTFALAEMLYALSVSWYTITNGDNGLTGINKSVVGLPFSIGNKTGYYYIILAFFVLSVIVLYVIIRSPFGRVLIGIRENEVRTRVLGYDTLRYKYFAIVISGTFAGLAGALKAYHDGVVTPDYFGVVTSGLVLLMVIMGGRRIFIGPILGAAVIWLLRQVISNYTEYWSAPLGVILVVVVLFARQGVGYYLVRWWEERRHERVGN